MNERLGLFIRGIFKKEKEQTYHYLFVSLPVGFLDDSTNEEEGIIGRILSDTGAKHKEFLQKNKNSE